MAPEYADPELRSLGCIRSWAAYPGLDHTRGADPTTLWSSTPATTRWRPTPRRLTSTRWVAPGGGPTRHPAYRRESAACLAKPAR